MISGFALIYTELQEKMSVADRDPSGDFAGGVMLLLAAAVVLLLLAVAAVVYAIGRLWARQDSWPPV